jgi:hypothetical protein
MKKIFVLLLVATFLIPAVAMAATANFLSEPIEATNNEPVSTLSSKVALFWDGTETTYAAVTGHSSGSKLYGSSSNATGIYSQVLDPAIAVDAGGSDSAAFSDASTWKKL